MATEITKDEINAVFPTVAETMADALGCDVGDIKLDVSLIEGLDAESIDFLDMVFRLERAFKIKIPRGKIIDNARGALSEAEFEQKGVLDTHRPGAVALLPVRDSGGPVCRSDEGQGHSPPLHAGDVLQAGRPGATRSQGGSLKGGFVSCPRVLLISPRFRLSTASWTLSRERPRGARFMFRLALPGFLRAWLPKRSVNLPRGCRWSTSNTAAGRSRRSPSRRASCMPWRRAMSCNSTSRSTTSTTTRCRIAAGPT